MFLRVDVPFGRLFGLSLDCAALPVGTGWDFGRPDRVDERAATTSRDAAVSLEANYGFKVPGMGHQDPPVTGSPQRRTGARNLLQLSLN